MSTLLIFSLVAISSLLGVNSAPLDSLNIAAGGTWMGTGTSQFRVLYPVDVLNPATPATIAWDDTNSRYVWFLTPVNTQWTLANGTYVTSNGVCYYSPVTYAQATVAFRSAVESVAHPSLFVGAIRDPATGPMYGTYEIKQKNNGRIAAMTFGQELNITPNSTVIPFIPGHIVGYVDLDDFSHSVPDSFWVLPSSCYYPQDYDTHFYPFGCFSTPI